MGRSAAEIIDAVVRMLYQNSFKKRFLMPFNLPVLLLPSNAGCLEGEQEFLREKKLNRSMGTIA